jgi:hypothetical protein
VDYRNSIDGVVLTLADGATVKASRAILTIPLGVMKTAPPMFDPELPSNMQVFHSLSLGDVLPCLMAGLSSRSSIPNKSPCRFVS